MQAELETIQGRYLPKMDLGPASRPTSSRPTRVSRTPSPRVTPTRSPRPAIGKGAILEELTAARDVSSPRQAAASASHQGYFAVASDVSRRLVSGETGEALVGAMAGMQAKQALALDRMKVATRLDRGELRAAFASISRTQTTVGRVQLFLSASCLGARDCPRDLSRSRRAALSRRRRSGAAAVWQGRLRPPIEVVSRDELETSPRRQPDG